MVALQHIQLKKAGLDVVPHQRKIRRILRRIRLRRSKTLLAGNQQLVLGGNGRRARVIELVIKRMVRVAVVSSLCRLHRLVAKTGEDKAIRLVEK